MQFAARTQWRFDRFVAQYGYLNEDKRGRDLVTDERHGRLMVAFAVYALVRTSGRNFNVPLDVADRELGLFLLTSDHLDQPSLDAFSPLRAASFILIMDYCKRAVFLMPETALHHYTSSFLPLSLPRPSI